MAQQFKTKQDNPVANSTDLTTAHLGNITTRKTTNQNTTSTATLIKSSPLVSTTKSLKSHSATLILPSTTTYYTTKTQSKLPYTFSKVITPSTAIINVTSVVTTSIHSNATTTPIPITTPLLTITTPTTTKPSTTKPSSHDANFLLYVGIPAVVVGFILLVILCMLLWCWYKRKQQRQREFTPCYAYDQSENEITDGVLYPSESNSVDLMCIDASPVVGRHDIHDDGVFDNDESCLLGSYNSTPNNNEMNDMASDVRRCESVAV